LKEFFLPHSTHAIFHAIVEDYTVSTPEVKSHFEVDSVVFMEYDSGNEEVVGTSEVAWRMPLGMVYRLSHRTCCLLLLAKRIRKAFRL
jgi:hypothetical protein